MPSSSHSGHPHAVSLASREYLLGSLSVNASIFQSYVKVYCSSYVSMRSLLDPMYFLHSCLHSFFRSFIDSSVYSASLWSHIMYAVMYSRHCSFLGDIINSGHNYSWTGWVEYLSCWSSYYILSSSALVRDRCPGLGSTFIFTSFIWSADRSIDWLRITHYMNCSKFSHGNKVYTYSK